MTAKKNQPVKNEPKPVRDAALALLARRAFGEGEMEAKLLGMGYTRRESADATNWLRGLGYVNDEVFARERAEELFARGWGRYRIRGELMDRMVDAELADEVIHDLPDAGEMIDGLIARLMAGRDPEDPKQRRRLAGALARRGFLWDEINAGLYRMYGE